MGLFDRIWRGWSNFMRGQPDPPDQQAEADAAEQTVIDRNWPTAGQQEAADAAEQENIENAYGEGGGDEGEGDEDGGEEEGGEPEAEPEGGE